MDNVVTVLQLISSSKDCQLYVLCSSLQQLSIKRLSISKTAIYVTSICGHHLPAYLNLGLRLHVKHDSSMIFRMN